MRCLPLLPATAAGLAAALCLLPTAAPAEVVQTAPNGFLVRHEATITAPPMVIYDTIVEQVGRWWSPDHTFSGDAANLTLDARPGGCFCERLPAGGGVEHMRVVYAAPGQGLRLTGALGPLQDNGLAGSLTLELLPSPGGTQVVLTYSVGGFMEDGFEAIAPAVDGVLGEQLKRLELFIETGAAAPRGDE